MRYNDYFYLKSNDEVLLKIKPMIKQGNINTVDNCGETLLGTAILYRNIQLIDFLLKNNADPNIKSDELYPVELAAALPDFPILKLLFKYGAKIQSDNHSLIYAIRARATTSIVSLLIKNGADSNDTADSISALYWATQSLNANTMEILLKNGANVDYVCDGGFTALLSAIGDGFIPGIKLLLKYGASNFNGSLQLAYNWCFPAIELLLEAGADINSRNDEGRTILHYAIIKSDFPTCDYLIKKGAITTIKDNSGFDFKILNDNQELRKEVYYSEFEED